MMKININEYLYIDYDIIDGNIVIINDHRAPKDSYYFRKVKDKYILELYGNPIGEIDINTGIFNSYVNLTTFEVKNAASDKASKGLDKEYADNKKMFKKDNPHPDLDTTKELHTHFIEVLSGEELLRFVKEFGYIDYILVDKETGKIARMTERKYVRGEYDKSQYVEIPIDDAIKDNKILEQLEAPVDRQVDFQYLKDRLPVRQALLNYTIYNHAKNKEEKQFKLLVDIEEKYDNLDSETKELKKEIKKDESKVAEYETKKRMMEQLDEKKQELYDEFKLDVYSELLFTSLEVLKKQGVNYVEFSYSGSRTIEGILGKIGKRRVDEIEFKFLQSHERNQEGTDFSRNCDFLIDLLENYPTEVIGADLMGEENLITEKDKTDSREECNTLYSRLKYLTTKLLVGSRNNDKKPTLRLHAGELFYDESASNPLITLQILKSIEDEIKNEYAELYDLMDRYKKGLITEEFMEDLKRKSMLHDRYLNASKNDMKDLIENYEKRVVERDQIINMLKKENLSESQRNKQSRRLETLNKKIKRDESKVGDFSSKDYSYDESELLELEKAKREYKIIKYLETHSLDDFDREVERIKDLKDNFSLRDRLNIRLGHALHFVDTKEYYELLKHFNVTVELCPSSNFSLGNLKSLKEIPYDKYIKHGIDVVLGTDGGGFYLTTLPQEVKLIFSKLKREKNLDKSKEKSKGTGEFDECLDLFLPKVKPPKKKGKNTGLDMSMSIKDYLPSKNDEHEFYSEYENAASQKKYVRSYFKQLYSINGDENREEISKLKREFIETQRYFVDLISNELYYNNSELMLISKTFDRIEKFLDEKRYTKAAMLLVSLQGVMNYRIELTEVLYLMEAYGVDFEECLTTKVVNKYRIDDVDNNYNNRNNIFGNISLNDLKGEYRKLKDFLNSNLELIDGKVDYTMSIIDDYIRKIEKDNYYNSDDDLRHGVMGVLSLADYLNIETKFDSIKETVDSKKYDLDEYIESVVDKGGKIR